MDKISAKELREKLKKLRSEHAGKAVGKMTAEEMSKEISHHETACRATELKAKRMEALAKAREARTAKKTEAEPKKKAKKVESDSDDEPPAKKKETIGDRIQKKKSIRKSSRTRPRRNSECGFRIRMSDVKHYESEDSEEESDNYSP
jgi:hypothetical protein